MPSCPQCGKKFCICESLAKKFIKKLRGSTVLDAAFGENSLNFHLYSLKQGEYYIQINLERLASSRKITPNEFVAKDRTPLLKRFPMLEISYSRYFPDIILLYLRSDQKEIYLKIERFITELSFEEYEREFKEALILSS